MGGQNNHSAYLENIKAKLIKRAEVLHLVRKYPQAYWVYFSEKKKEIKKLLRENDISEVCEASFDTWKLWYGCCYFSGKLLDKKGERKNVFIKVMDRVQFLDFQNEKTVNCYIESKSSFLAERKPKIYQYIETDKYLMIIYEYVHLESAEYESGLREAILSVVDEYSRIGILHTDFGMCNLGRHGDMLMFFDYGTSLCVASDKVGLRRAYNHIDKVTKEALSLLDEPDFYYDDLVHCGIIDADRSRINFLVGKDKVFYAKLGDIIIKYHLERKSPNSSVFLLCKDNAETK